MLKSDLIAILVAKRQLTQKQAELTIETIFESMNADADSTGTVLFMYRSNSRT